MASVYIHSSANVNHLYQFFDKTCKIITYIVIWFWWLKCYFSLGISLTQNPQHLRLTSICSHSIKLSYLLSYINLVLNSVSHELKRSLFHAKLRIFSCKTISMIKNIQGIFGHKCGIALVFILKHFYSTNI